MCQPIFDCDDEDRFDEWEEVTRIAEEESKCCECGHKILTGETYRLGIGNRYIWKYSPDDKEEQHTETETYETCFRCMDLADSLRIFSCYTGDRILTDLLVRSEDYIRECMVPNLAQDKKYLAIPYYKKLIRARRGY